jgi:hypothetical protein
MMMKNVAFKSNLALVAPHLVTNHYLVAILRKRPFFSVHKIIKRHD